MRDLIHRRYNTLTRCLRLEPARDSTTQKPPRKTPHLLFAREIAGRRGFGALRRYNDFHTSFRNEVEDCLEPRMGSI
ncbi:uncharacterized protein B0I36DRAFT_341348, partial [Microdochium trichocladiopsis]